MYCILVDNVKTVGAAEELERSLFMLGFTNVTRKPVNCDIDIIITEGLGYNLADILDELIIAGFTKSMIITNEDV